MCVCRVVLVLLVGLVLQPSTSSRHYSSQWAAHIEGGPLLAESIATRHGFTFLGEIFPDCYHLQHSSVARRSISPSNEHHDNLLSEREVKWARQQKVISRSKRDFTKFHSSESLFPLNDPKWTQMWYLNRGSGLDMSVQEAWNDGVTGRGVVVTILDDGLERDHPDLLKNYDPQASYDVNNHDDDPMPRYDLIDSNRHGTRCAGEVAAVANNSLCSVGIAYNAHIGGVRMLDGDVTDAVEARSLSLNPQHIDIYSASWGPDDDGKTVDGPGELAVRAFVEGVTKGRAGKGSIFIWASGNGGRDHDNCNCDGYTNSIWTLSISSATEKGFVPWYSEACSSTLATTYSSGSTGEKQVITTDLHRMCTISHSGTSASAPLAAGICALALEANRDLTWRDMQHIVVASARPANLKAPDWTTNGVGRNVSHSFGYGLMDAAEMVKLARKWRTVPEQHKCEVIANTSDKLIPAKSSVTLTLNVKNCPGVNYLEHVQAKISLNSQRRGDLQIHLTSPAGTKSTLLARRPHDVSRVGFQQWPFMSVHTWGESPFGTWYLEIHNEGRFLGQLQDWNMIFYGTEGAPMSAENDMNPSTIRMSTKAPLSTQKPVTDRTSMPSLSFEGSKKLSQTPAEIEQVFNTVRDKSTLSKSSGFENGAVNSSSLSSLVCRRSANICIGLCLIILLVEFFFDDFMSHFRLERRGGRKAERIETKRSIGKFTDVFNYGNDNVTNIVGLHANTDNLKPNLTDSNLQLKNQKTYVELVAGHSNSENSLFNNYNIEQLLSNHNNKVLNNKFNYLLHNLNTNISSFRNFIVSPVNQETKELYKRGFNEFQSTDKYGTNFIVDCLLLDEYKNYYFRDNLLKIGWVALGFDKMIIESRSSVFVENQNKCDRLEATFDMDHGFCSIPCFQYDISTVEDYSNTLQCKLHNDISKADLSDLKSKNFNQNNDNYSNYHCRYYCHSFDTLLNADRKYLNKIDKTFISEFGGDTNSFEFKLSCSYLSIYSKLVRIRTSISYLPLPNYINSSISQYINTQNSSSSISILSLTLPKQFILTKLL